jgi:tetratricopeptide (TPR) repeat protein
VRSDLSNFGCALVISLSWLALEARPQDLQQKIGGLEQQVQKHLQDQKPQLAIPVLRELLSLDPKNLNAQANLGVLLFFDGRYAEAIPHMRAAIELKPDLPRIQALLGMAEKRTGERTQARADLERAFANLDDKKIRVDAGLELIELYSAVSELDQALATAIKLQELAPENPQVLFVTWHISRQVMDQTLVKMIMVAPESAEMHMIMGGELARQGSYTNAIARYREAIRLNPKLPGAHFELAELLRTSSDPALNAQAEGEYRAAIEVNENDQKSWRQLGEIMAARGDVKTAEQHYKRALALEPADSAAKTGLAVIFSSTNRMDQAISVLETAVRDDPTNTSARYRLSGLYRRAGRTADAEREMAAFHHYKELGEKLDKTYRQLRGAVREK